MADNRPVADKGGDGGVWVGVDLGGTKMLAVVYDDEFKKLGKKRKKTLGNEGTEAGLARLAETIEKAMVDAGAAGRRIRAIGGGIPGPLDLQKGILLESPNLGWRKAAIRDVLGKRFGCPVHLTNDVDAGVYGEYRFGAGIGADTVFGIFPGTGIGGGFVYRGDIVRGARLSCMEIGHIQVMPDGPLCGCGNRGCLEAVASRLAIASAAVSAAFRGEAPHLLREVGTDVSRVRSSALARAIEAGDQVVEDIVREAARWIGVGTANVINLLAPEIVILGGGLVEAMPKLLRGAIEEAAVRHVMPSFRKQFEIKVATLGDDATVLGAAAWAKQESLAAG
jgi:glucokinase